MNHSSDEEGGEESEEWQTDDEEDSDDSASENDDEEGSALEDSKNEDASQSIIDEEIPKNEAEKKPKETKAARKARRLKEKMKQKVEKKIEYTAEKKEKAMQVSVDRILTDEDFNKIDMALAKQQVTFAKRGAKRPAEDDPNRGELVKLADIENIYKKRKHDKLARMESVKVRIFFLFLDCITSIMQLGIFLFLL